MSSSGRSYNVSDSEVVTASRSIYDNYMKHSKKFEAQNAVYFTPAFPAKFLGTIQKAGGIGRHAEVRHLITEDTAEMKKARTVAVKEFKILKLDVRFTWPRDATSQNIFGTKAPGKVLKGPIDELILFLESLQTLILEHYNELLAGGYTAEKHAAFNAAVTALRDSIATQDESIRSRPGKTQARSAVMNELHDMLRKIYDAAEIIFDGDEASIALFALPKPPKPPKKDPKPDLD